MPQGEILAAFFLDEIFDTIFLDAFFHWVLTFAPAKTPISQGTYETTHFTLSQRTDLHGRTVRHTSHGG
jgi:hypothetical protein